MSAEPMTFPDLYEQNKEFWGRAWSGVKKPYTEMPPLPYIDKISEALGPAAGGPVLDLGCGSGWLSVFLARQGFQVTGVDVAPNALALAQMWAQMENLPINFITADIIDLDFAHGSFQAVVANSIFEHLTHDLAHQCIELVSNSLASEGVFFGCFDHVGTGPGEYYKLEDGTHVYTDKGRAGMMLRNFSDEELKDLLKPFRIKEFQTLETGSRIVIAVKP